MPRELCQAELQQSSKRSFPSIVVCGSRGAPMLWGAELSMSLAVLYVLMRQDLESSCYHTLPPRKGSELKCLPRV